MQELHMKQPSTGKMVPYIAQYHAWWASQFSNDNAEGRVHVVIWQILP